MNPFVEKLYSIARKEYRLVIGLMSGTSLDGLDIALCRITGGGSGTSLDLLNFTTKSYPGDFQARVRKVFAKRMIDQQELVGLNAWIGAYHGGLINDALSEWGIAADGVDLIASHGQTVYHAPQSLTADASYPNSTLQIGDGDHVAVTTGIITISDFRQKHVAAGGEGAPLAVYGDYLLFSDAQEPRILLNIGGIANLTCLPPRESGRPCFATDVGPGNTLMDQYIQAETGMAMDWNAGMASSGTVHRGLLAALLDHGFFSLPFPKTTGPELFNLAFLAAARESSRTMGLPGKDVMATLCAFSAEAIIRSVQEIKNEYPRARVYVSGGGLHNPLLMRFIKEGCSGTDVCSFNELGLLPDAKEAVLFAVLANEAVAGNPANVKAIRNAPAVCMGKFSFPA